MAVLDFHPDSFGLVGVVSGIIFTSQDTQEVNIVVKMTRKNRNKGLYLYQNKAGPHPYDSGPTEGVMVAGSRV